MSSIQSEIEVRLERVLQAQGSNPATVLHVFGEQACHAGNPGDLHEHGIPSATRSATDSSAHISDQAGRVPVSVKVRCGSAGQTNRAADGQAGLARSALAMPEGDAGRGHGICAHESPARSMLSGSRTRIMIGSRSLQSTRRNRSTRWGFHKRTPCGVRWRSKAARISARHAASRFRSLWVTSMKRAAKLSQSG